MSVINFLNIKKKAQTSIEFLIIIGVLFALFAFAVYIGGEKSSTIGFQEEFIEAQGASRYLANTINAVNMMPNGTEKIITLNNKYNYKFATHNYGLHLILPDSNSYFDFPLTTMDINFNGTNYNYISIKKINNYIVIQDAN